MEEKKLENIAYQLNTDLMQWQIEIEKNAKALTFYETSGLQESEAILKTATESYRAGDISVAEMNSYLTQAVNLKLNHLQQLRAYNRAVIESYFYTQP